MTRAGSYAVATGPALLALGFFVWFANWIPQTSWEPPKVLEVTAQMSAAALAKVGEAITRERGCRACHTIERGAGIKGQGRGPNLWNVAARRAAGVPGGPDNLAAYLTQTLYEPGAYLVEGYANIMPRAVRAPAKLSYEEVTAVVAYLESLGGTPSVRVGDLPRPPAKGKPPAAAPSAAPDEIVPGDPKEILAAFDCLTCHSLEPGEVLIGPPFEAGRLKQAAAERGMTPEAYIMESVIEPRAVQRDDFPKETMPDDYGERLNAAQLYAVTAFLVGSEKEK